MRTETKDRLNKAIRRQWFIKIGIGALAALAVVGVLELVGLDTAVENHLVEGRVEHVGPLPTKDARTGLLVDVMLADGRRAQVIALKTTDPHVGDHVTIAEHVHASGRTTFTWR